MELNLPVEELTRTVIREDGVSTPWENLKFSENFFYLEKFGNSLNDILLGFEQFCKKYFFDNFAFESSWQSVDRPN